MEEKKQKVTRRKFDKGSAVAVAGAAGAVAMPNIARAAPVTLKVQAAWGGGIFLENAKSYVDRVHAMAGKDLKIDLLSVNSVVKTSQMQDAVHRGVLDGAHYVPAYWYSKSKAASLFGTGPCFGWSAQEMLGWIHYGGGLDLFNELMGSLGLNLVSFFNSPMPAQPLGWFKERISRSSQMKGLKYRTVGLAADVMNEMGMSVVQLPGGEIQPAMKSGLIDAAEFNNPTSDSATLTFKGPPLPDIMKVREELETTISNGELLLRILLKSGWNVSFRYQKYRKEFQKDDVVIAIDETPVGTFIELEGKETTITRLARTLGHTTDDYVIASYRQLYVEHCIKTNKPIGNMVFSS